MSVFVAYLITTALSNKNPASAAASLNNFRTDGRHERARFFGVIVRIVRKIANYGYWLRHFSLSVHMEQLGSHWTLSLNLIFEYFSKIC
jgi:hypothetical protein